MTTLPNVNFTAGRPVRADELAEIINQDRAKINSLPAANLQKTEAGKVQINITGDAATVGGLTAGEIAGADFAVFAKTLAELLVNSDGLVISGGKATKNAGTANQLDITAIVAIQKDADGKLNRVEMASKNKTTSTGSTTYYLDVVPGAVDYSWSTEHPAPPYLPVAVVATDGSGNILTVTDVRPTSLTMFASLLPTIDVIALGETETTAYRGDRGAAAYAHSQVATGPTHGAVSAETGGTMVVRDEIGRSRFADPSHAKDAANKGYVDSRPSVSLGETETTAYRGDRGKVAYDHSQAAHAYLPLAGGTLTGTVAANAVVNINQTNGRLVLPVGTNKYATG